MDQKKNGLVENSKPKSSKSIGWDESWKMRDSSWREEEAQKIPGSRNNPCQCKASERTWYP